MNLQPTYITPDQWRKVLKALAYSFGSGFAGGFVLAITGALSGLVQTGNHIAVGASLVTALVVGGVVGGLNSLAVTIKQLFTSGE